MGELSETNRCVVTIIMDISQNNIYINCNVGANTITDYQGEIEKIKAIKDSGDIPDMMMDLSLVKQDVPLYRIVQDTLNIYVGTVTIIYSIH